MVFGQTFELGLLGGELIREDQLVIRFRREPPVDRDHIAIELDPQNLQPSAKLERSIWLVDGHQSEKDR